jgi:hypothetical protein
MSSQKKLLDAGHDEERLDQRQLLTVRAIFRSSPLLPLIAALG